MTSKNTATSENKYFNLHVNGIGYLSNIRQVNGPKGQFLTAVINALSGPADNPVYVCFDTTVVGENTVSLVRRCIKAVDEDKKVLTGFTLSNLASDIFTLTKGEHAGEQRVSLKARLLNIDWIKIGKEVVYKAEKNQSTPPGNEQPASREYAADSF
ncbi:STY4534 family ICE replication protein [Proteus mirabilis]|uniref:STY4534 family ICE replication protein n=1 Tax=Proteus mirabilis TaxID=584 RepID=UPI002958A25B|nr:STY4534 family ICE replication protein [Proteus mirabilis]WOR94980.1 STY4534 family ICE replication protein [Proteus mirabilis]WOS13878.1 STY4534 family ICE replication protein [Proteus mirabilis]